MAVVKLCGIKSEEDAALMNEVKPESTRYPQPPPAGFQISSDTAGLSVFL